MRTLMISVLLLFPILVWSQVKFERESRLKETEIPAPARQFITEADIQTRVKWYYEENLEGNSVEAKFRQGKSRYSVEFDTLGNIQDVEIEIEPNTLSKQQQQKLNGALDALFTKYRIRKIQRQYRGSSSELQEVLQKEGVLSSAQIRYEIVIKGRNDDGVKLYEITFDEEGQLLEQRQIIFRNSEHLEY